MFQKATFIILVVGLFGASPCFAAHFPLDYFAAQGNQDESNLIGLAEQGHIYTSSLGKISVIELIGSGNYSQAYQELYYVLDRIPNHPKGLQILGSLAQLTKKESIAVSYYEKALSKYPQWPLTYAQYGQFLLEIGQVDNAIEKLKRATEIDPKLVGGFALLAKAYSKKGNNDLAREAAAKAKELGYQGK